MAKIDDKHRTEICRSFKEKEINDIIEEMRLGKSSGPDNLTAEFYKVIGTSSNMISLKTITNFQILNYIPDSSTQTQLIFIPKLPNPQGINDYRPLVLCNVNYKILLKALANRIKTHLLNLIKHETICVH